jgi:PAS domain S-box-containing protein
LVLGNKESLKNISNLKDALNDLKPHDHLCFIYNTHQQWIDVIIPFIKKGIENKEKCIYFLEKSAKGLIRDYLKKEGLDVEFLEDSGQLLMLDEYSSYTPDGFFNIEFMLDFLKKETQKALSEGYVSLRMIWDMIWAMKEYPGSENLIEYELRLEHEFFKENPVIAICCYYNPLFDPEILKDIILTHPIIIKDNKLYENSYYVPPEDFLTTRKIEKEFQTWLKNMEIEFEISEKKNLYSDFLNKSAQPLAIGTPDGKIMYYNNAFINLIGYSPEEINDLNWIKDITPEKYWDYENRQLEKLKKIMRVRYEKEYITKYGSIIPVELMVHPAYDNQGKIKHYYAFITDITHHKKTEETLIESENRYEVLFDNAAEGIFIMRGNHFVDCNKKAMEIYGVTKEDIIAETPYSTFSPDKQPDGQYSEDKAKKIIGEALKGNPQHFEWEHKRLDGTKFFAEIRLNRLKIGDEYLLQAIINDITGKKELEEDLKWKYALESVLSDVYPVLISSSSTLKDVSELLLEKALEITDSSDGYVAIIDAKTKEMVMLNPTKMMEECKIGTLENFRNRFPPGEDGIYPSLWGESLNTEKGFYTNEPKKHESSTGIPKGHVVLNRFISVPAFINSEILGQISLSNSTRDYGPKDLEALERIAKFYAMAIQRLRANEEIVKSLEDKKLLLREIHHRVKNNLQIISSLLNLQADEANNSQVEEFRRLSQDRIRAMALIHEKLYKSHDINQIDLQSYITSLIESLFISYDVSSSLNLKLKVDDIKLNLDTAIPCGLILNELITNIIKYAFPNNPGNLEIECTENNNEFTLIVWDDGVGLPSDINIDSPRTLGLRIVKSLTDQIDGTLELDRSKGTKFIIKFHELQYKNRL